MASSSDDNAPETTMRRRVQFSPELTNEIRKVIIEEENTEKKKTPFVIAFLEAAVWVAAAAAVIVYSNFIEEIKTSLLINRFYFNLGLVFLLTFTSCGFYAVFWCSWIKGDHEWERIPSLFFPSAAFCVSAGLVCATIGLWPVWSWLTPFIVFIVMMGTCMPMTIL